MVDTVDLAMEAMAVDLMGTIIILKATQMATLATKTTPDPIPMGMKTLGLVACLRSCVLRA